MFNILTFEYNMFKHPTLSSISCNAMHYTGKYAEAKDGWDSIGPLAFFHREKDEVSQNSYRVIFLTGPTLILPSVGW